MQIWEVLIYLISSCQLIVCESFRKSGGAFFRLVSKSNCGECLEIISQDSWEKYSIVKVFMLTCAWNPGKVWQKTTSTISQHLWNSKDKYKTWYLESCGCKKWIEILSMSTVWKKDHFQMQRMKRRFAPRMYETIPSINVNMLFVCYFIPI